jgi:hypothetical protein
VPNAPIEPAELVVTIPAALTNLFEKASAIVFYVLILFINRQERLRDQVKRQEEEDKDSPLDPWHQQ